MYNWTEETRKVWYAISGRTVWWHERCTDCLLYTSDAADE